MYKMDLVLNNLQWVICHKIKPNPSKNVITLQTETFFLEESA